LSNKSPDIVLLFSLCYWIRRCRKLIDACNFDIKFNELKDSFQSEAVTTDLQQMSNTINILKDISLEKETREKTAQNMITRIQKWLKTIISFYLNLRFVL